MRTRRSRARISVAVIAILAITGMFVVRLADIQVVRAEVLNEESHEKRAQELVTPGIRGEIVDANGAVLADSVERWDITASPRVAFLAEEPETTIPEQAAALAAVTGVDAQQLVDEIYKDPMSDFTYLVRSVTLEVLEKVQDLDIPWVYSEFRPARTYPNGEIAGNLVGFIGTDGPQAGLELTENDCLASTDGRAVYEKSMDGVRLPGSLVTTEEPKNGGTLNLTIDRDLQWWVQQRMIQTGQELGATWTSSVVMRISDGALMAVADWPTVDPNDVSSADVSALGSRAFSTPYEPGSTIKALTAASLIDAGVATPSTPGVVAPYTLELPDGGGVIKDAFPHEPQNLTLTGTLVESSNTATAQFSYLLSPEARHDYLEAFGFNDYTEVGFNGESSGTVYPAEDWDARTRYTVQFGQGMTVTPVQLASAFQTLGNGGLRMPVKLVEGCEWADGTVTDQPASEGRQVISESAADQTIAMMENVTTSSNSGPNLQIPGYRVAVKSGTAEVVENGAYTNKVVISYAGVAPAEDPQYVVMVAAGIPNTIFSGTIASTFRDVMAHTLTTFRVPASNEPSPQLPTRW